jgi:hypothetical protein
MPEEPGRLAEEVDGLREQAARTAAICGDCFQPLAPQASVTMEERFVWDDALYDRSLRVPICICCWLVTLERRAIDHMCLGIRTKGSNPRLPRGNRHRRHIMEARAVAQYIRFHCDGCARPMRMYQDELPPRGKRVCCERCLHRAYYKRHRKVEQRPRRCAVCRATFIPTRSDQVTHSAACRQKLYRLRHRGALPSSRR